MKPFPIILLITLLFATGCTSQQKLAYLNNLPETAGEQYFPMDIPDYKIQNRDVLYITLKAMDPEGAIKDFLGLTSSTMNMSYMGSTGGGYLWGYNVNKDGNIILPVLGEVKVEGEIGKSTVPAGRYAVGHFEIKETEFEQAWNTMCSWLTESGYQPADGPTYELYHNDYKDHPEHRFIVDICLPVKPL